MVYFVPFINVNTISMSIYVLQVTEELAEVLRLKGFALNHRGPVYVKGKGTMVTYLLSGPRVTPTGGVIGWFFGKI